MQRPAPFDESILDELIPPPMGPYRKLATTAVLIAVAVAGAILYNSGYVVPQASNAGEVYADLTYVDHQAGLVAVAVELPNTTGRDLRLTDITVVAPGIEVVRVDVAVWPNERSRIGRGAPFGIGSMTEASEQWQISPLPMHLPAQDLSLADADDPAAPSAKQALIWFRPTSCIDPAPPWGTLEYTVDFGEGAFPPLARTFESTRPVWTGDSVNVLDVDQRLVGPGPLSVACEVVQ